MSSAARADIEAFVRRLVAEIEADEAAGIATPAAIAERLNARGVTTRKGRRWSAASVTKLLASPGARRYRTRAGPSDGPSDGPQNEREDAALRRLSDETIAYYDRSAAAFRDGTRDHDVSQNTRALLGAIEGDPPFSILDLGCGPGRDLRYFRALGHEAVGLDGSIELVAMARAASGCEVWHQDFLAMDLPPRRFDGVFANASLFHVPSRALPRVLGELHETLKPRGVLFCSNPRGNNEEGFSGGRFGCFFDLDTWRAHVTAAGFVELDHYFRPPGLPRERQPWLASVWRRP